MVSSTSVNVTPFTARVTAYIGFHPVSDVGASLISTRSWKMRVPNRMGQAPLAAAYRA